MTGECIQGQINELRRMTRRLRIDFEQNIAMNVKEKPKHFWKYAKSRIKKKEEYSNTRKARWIKSNNTERKSKFT